MKLRPMTMWDADFMLKLKNYEETRKFSISTPHEITREDHIKWLTENVQYFEVIEEAGERAGAVRVQDNEISIWLDRDFRGKGLALITINSVKEKGMKAQIVKENIPSMRAFIRAGFLPKVVLNDVYLFEYEK